MNSILEKIVEVKQQEILQLRRERSLDELREAAAETPRPDFEQALTAEGVRIIAEVKYRSPSRGRFRCRHSPVDVASAYARAGAAAVSVLTDETFFGGSPRFLEDIARRQQAGERPVPVLRKDFVLDRHQLAEAAALGASACLLIVACLEPRRLEALMEFAAEIDLATLVEVHDESELETAVEAGAGLIGVNNRNLTTFETSLEVSFRLARMLEGESDFVLVAESGLAEPAQLLELEAAGFSAFLIGGSLMDTEHPGAALAALIDAVSGNPAAGARS